MKQQLKTVRVFMIIAAIVFLLSPFSSFAGALNIDKACVQGDYIVVTGTTAIDSHVSTYIQYYVGKEYPETLSNCIYSAGFHANKDGTFRLRLPVSNLKGPGTYHVVLEQNPRSNKIIPPEKWVAFRKVDGKIVFGEISSMGELGNLALTVGMDIAEARVVVGNEKITSPITITSSKVKDGKIVVTGRSAIDPSVSSYIQYYVGKIYKGTLANCIYCDGFNTDSKGNFRLEILLSKLKGDGRYEIVLEQNPRSNKILPPKHWVAFRKVDGKIVFGDISSMGEISNLALTVGMKAARTEIQVGAVKELRSQITIADAKQVGNNVIITGKSTVDTGKSTYIQYYVGKMYPDTLSNCILSDGFHVNKDGSFSLAIPVAKLKGPGKYEIALEQNPRSNKILPPKYWVAFRKVDGKIVFGEISSMGEISNLALTVGMELDQTSFLVK